MWNDKSVAPDKQACYFITFTTVDCVDVFIRPVYKQVVVHTLNHFIETKGLIVYSWCLMTNHLHLLIQAEEGNIISDIEQEYKSFTTTKILEAIDTEPEIRKKWMMDRFANCNTLLSFLKKYHVWQNSEEAVYIDMNKQEELLEHFCYIHENPVRDRFVDSAIEYSYSSARDYAGMPGLVNVTKPARIEQHLAASENINGNFCVKYIRN